MFEDIIGVGKKKKIIDEQERVSCMTCNYMGLADKDETLCPKCNGVLIHWSDNSDDYCGVSSSGTGVSVPRST